MTDKLIPLIAAVGLLGACSEEPRQTAPVVVPVADMVGGSGPTETGWTPIGTTASRPALSLYEYRRPTLVITCEGMSIHVQVRGFEPKQAWPQPELRLTFGAAVRAAVPDVRNIGEQVAYETSFRIADDVLSEISAGAEISADFSEQTKTFLAVPDELGRAFASGCSELLPAPLRRSD